MIKKIFLVNWLSCLFLCSVLGIYVYRRYATRYGLLDIPNARSSHDVPKVRGGGLVFVLLWAMGVGLAVSQQVVTKECMLWSLPASLGFALLGYWEDTKGVSIPQRLLWQSMIAWFFIQSIGEIAYLHLGSKAPFLLGTFGLFAGILMVVWSVNLFNFMDGLDGLAAIESCFVLGGGGLLCWQAGGRDLALLAWSMVVVIAGFLVWNWPRASVFMGDVGSYCLGFLIACCAIVGDLQYQVPILVWGILYGVFWFDATVTLLRRVLLKRNWTAAHREHAYQRLHQIGWSHQQVLWAVMGLNSLLVVLAFIANAYRETLWFCCLTAVGLLTLAYLWIERLHPLQAESK